MDVAKWYSRFATAAFTAAAAAGGVYFLRRSLREFSMMSPQRLCAASDKHRHWMRRMKAFIFDIDGVIHVNGVLVQGAPEALAALRSAGKTVIFMTNNATKTREDVVATFSKIGASAQPQEIMTSAVAAANYLESKGLKGQKVYVIGETALSEIIEKHAGVKAFGSAEDAKKTREDVLRDFLPSMDPPPEEVVAVVVGADFGFNYYKMARAANYLRQNRSCLFVATNPDPRVMLGPGTVAPAAGSMIEAVATVSGRLPDIVCGKPSESLARYMLERWELDSSTTCMVGDRTDTDIEFGRSVGMQTLFVESGTMSRDEALMADAIRRPHFLAESIAVLQELL